MERLDLGQAQFTQADVLRILPRLPSKTLQNWKYRGILDSESSSPGKGNRHLYTGHGIVMLAFMERIVDIGLDPAEVKQISHRAATCAQELWDLGVDELRSNGMRQIRNWFSPGNTVYRRAFIKKDFFSKPIHVLIARNERTGSFSPRPYIVDAIDIQNIGVLNRINRHISGLPPVDHHITDDFDEDGPVVDAKRSHVLSRISSLPVDPWDDDV